ncbi:unnamed protein product, partial [Adineta steineri]
MFMSDVNAQGNTLAMLLKLLRAAPQRAELYSSLVALLPNSDHLNTCINWWHECLEDETLDEKTINIFSVEWQREIITKIRTNNEHEFNQDRDLLQFIITHISLIKNLNHYPDYLRSVLQTNEPWYHAAQNSSAKNRWDEESLYGLFWVVKQDLRYEIRAILESIPSSQAQIKAAPLRQEICDRLYQPGHPDIEFSRSLAERIAALQNFKHSIKNIPAWLNRFTQLVTAETPPRDRILFWQGTELLSEATLQVASKAALFQNNEDFILQRHLQTGELKPANDCLPADRRHVVLPLPSDNPVAYAKFFPDAPGNEIAVSYLHELFIGHGAPMTSLARFLPGTLQQEHPYPVLFSEAVHLQSVTNNSPLSHTKRDRQQEADSLYERGLQYKNGDRVSPNPVVAINYFKQAADIGHGEAQLMVAQCYKLGQGTPVNHLLALFWFARAQEIGIPRAFIEFSRACTDLDDLTKFTDYLNPNKQSNLNWERKDPFESVSWHTLEKQLDWRTLTHRLMALNTEKNHHQVLDAQFTLAQAYENGEGIPRSSLTAIYWCQKAARQNYKNAVNMLQQYHQLSSVDINMLHASPASAIPALWSEVFREIPPIQLAPASIKSPFQQFHLTNAEIHPRTRRLHTLIQELVHSTSDRFGYRSMRFEPARLKGLLEKPDVLKALKKEWDQPPSHQGFISSIQMRELRLVHHPALWQRYQERKERLKGELQQRNIKEVPGKDRAFRDNIDLPTDGFHSTYGPRQDAHSGSQFDCNEFCINDGAQIYPEYVIKYTLNPRRDPSPALKIPSFSNGLFHTSLSKALKQYAVNCQYASLEERIHEFEKLFDTFLICVQKCPQSELRHYINLLEHLEEERLSLHPASPQSTPG